MHSHQKTHLRFASDKRLRVSLIDSRGKKEREKKNERGIKSSFRLKACVDKFS
jgi:hypothetical protein